MQARVLFEELFACYQQLDVVSSACKFVGAEALSSY